MSQTNELNQQECQTGGQCQSSAVERAVYARPRYAIREGDTAYVAEVDLPGVSKSGAEITLEEGVLEIVGRRSWKAPEGWASVGGERSEDGYRLKLAIGDQVDAQKIEATVSEGVLTLTLTKLEEKQPRKIEIA